MPGSVASSTSVMPRRGKYGVARVGQITSVEGEVTGSKFHGLGQFTKVESAFASRTVG